MQYRAVIDGGEGGETVFLADSLEAALAEAIAWAEQGDWFADGRALVSVEGLGFPTARAEEIIDVYGPRANVGMKAECGCVIEHIECEFCDEVYDGPNCGHVAQPTPVAGCAGCGRGVCEDCVDDADGYCPLCVERRDN